MDLSKAQIEHVMPQTLTPEWLVELGDSAEEEASSLLHTLGNLTLTKYNSELSNKPFQIKKIEFSKSHFVLNRYFANVDKWSPDAIRQRGRDLAKIAVGIWSDVGRESFLTEAKKQSSFILTKIRFRDSQQIVTNWKDGFVKLLQYFDTCNPGLLVRIATEKSLLAVLDLDKDRYRRSKVQIGVVFVNTHASAAQLQDWCRKVAKIGLISTSDFEFITSEQKSV